MMISSFPTWRCTSKCGITIISREDGRAFGLTGAGAGYLHGDCSKWCWWLTNSMGVYL
jgi:hypothetical protein